jgi:broad specificity phosphatase PhoE
MPPETSSERPVVWLVRHGETAWNAEGRMQGHTDVPLTERGRAQAHALAERLRSEPPARIVSSDLSRALETASFVGAACGVVPSADRRLREQDLGAWSGRTFPQVEAVDPDLARRFRAYDPEARPPGGETRAELASRVWAAFEAHAHAGSTGPLLIVAHGGPIQAVIYRVLGLPLTTVRRFRLPNVGLTTLLCRGGHWYVQTLNDTTHLASTSGDRFPFE